MNEFKVGDVVRVKSSGTEGAHYVNDANDLVCLRAGDVYLVSSVDGGYVSIQPEGAINDAPFFSHRFELVCTSQTPRDGLEASVAAHREVLDKQVKENIRLAKAAAAWKRAAKENRKCCSWFDETLQRLSKRAMDRRERASKRVKEAVERLELAIEDLDA